MRCQYFNLNIPKRKKWAFALQHHRPGPGFKFKLLPCIINNRGSWVTVMLIEMVVLFACPFFTCHSWLSYLANWLHCINCCILLLLLVFFLYNMWAFIIFEAPIWLCCFHFFLVISAKLLIKRSPIYHYERARSARSFLFNLGEKYEYERSAGRGHAFERLISQQPRDRLTSHLLCWIASFLLPSMCPIPTCPRDHYSTWHVQIEGVSKIVPML